jgi:hypothetical protein
MTIHNRANAKGLSSLLTVMSLLGASLGVAIALPDEGRGSDKSVTDKNLPTKLAQAQTDSKPKYQMDQMKMKSKQYKTDQKPKYQMNQNKPNTLNPQPLPPESPPPKRQ